MILDDVEAELRKLVILKSDAHYVAETLWIAHTYAIASFDFTPRLATAEMARDHLLKNNLIPVFDSFDFEGMFLKGVQL